MTQENNQILNLAPIVLFVYNRVDHTKQTIEALQKNELASDSELYIYSDEAKNVDERAKVDEVRAYVDSIDGFKKVTLIKREKNWGLADSIIDGVTSIVNEYGKIIVLEDDLVTSPHFLKFMNEALEFYKDEEKVYSITGYSFTDEIKDIDSTYMLGLTSSWSWSTWSNKWKIFKRDSNKLKDFIQNKSNHKNFNFNNSYDFISMAKSQLDNKIDSWAIYWYFSVFLENGLTLYPSKSLVQNIGFDGSGVHCGASDKQKKLSEYYHKFTNDIFEKNEIKPLVANILIKDNSIALQDKVKRIIKSRLTIKQKQLLTIVISKVKLFFYKKDIGKNTYIDKSVHVTGWKNISIGKNTGVSENTWINVNERLGNKKHIIIGNNCYVGRRNFFSSGILIKISDYFMSGVECKFMGSDHLFDNPLLPYISTGTTTTKEIIIESNVWLGAGVTVIGNIKIGRGSIIGAGSLVNKDIPSFSIAVGNPCKVIKRFDFSTNKWIKTEEYTSSKDVLIPSEDKYIELLNQNFPNVIIPFVACGKRKGDLL